MPTDRVRRPPLAREDVLGAASIAGRGFAAASRTVGDVHHAIAGRVFGVTGRPSTPARVAHNGISRGVYATVAGGGRAAAYLAGQAAAGSRRRSRDGAARLGDRPRGDLVLGALNGAWGDTFAGWRNPLALSMTVRAGGRDVPLTPPALRRAFPTATDDVVVFVHGLCETDRAWWLGAAGHYGDAASTHGARLAALTGATPVYLRYNTGLHISDNGARLAGLLADLVEHWPVAIRRLTLVGHSMGGLVIRSACCQGEQDHQPWVKRVRRIIYLGSPHLGAPLELAATAAGVALRRLPETRPLAVALASRSVGIKDLRYGDISAADWAELADPDAWRAEPTECAALLTSAEHYYVGVTLTQRPDHPVARMIGDALVTYASASGNGRRRRLAFDVDRGCHLGGLHHFDLLNHPRVWAVLRSWLADVERR